MDNKVNRVFLDSNVILSGLISDKGAPRIILDILSLRFPSLIGLTGQYNLLEIERNLENKLPNGLPLYRTYSVKLHLEIVPMPSREEIKKFAGITVEKDIPVLASAVTGKADFFITGDKKDFEHLKTKREFAFKILSPSDFVNEILPNIIRGLIVDKTVQGSRQRQ